MKQLLDSRRDELLLLARVLLVVLFVIYGWEKMLGFSATINQMTRNGLPIPVLAAAIAVIVELLVGIAVALGFQTRSLALILAVYTLAAGLIGHHYWTMEGAARAGNMINFYKNISIIGGFLALSVTGPGRYSIDRG